MTFPNPSSLLVPQMEVETSEIFGVDISVNKNDGYCESRDVSVNLYNPDETQGSPMLMS